MPTQASGNWSLFGLNQEYPVFVYIYIYTHLPWLLFWSHFIYLIAFRPPPLPQALHTPVFFCEKRNLPTKKPRKWQRKWRKMDSSKNCFKQLGQMVGLGTGKNGWESGQSGIMNSRFKPKKWRGFVYKAMIRSFLLGFVPVIRDY